MTFKHISLSLPAVPMGDNFKKPFLQSDDALKEYAAAMHGRTTLSALVEILDHLVPSQGLTLAEEAMVRRAKKAVGAASGGCGMCGCTVLSEHWHENESGYKVCPNCEAV